MSTRFIKTDKLTISLRALPLTILYLCSALTGFLPQSILNIVILAMLAVMMLQNTLFLAYPIMIFYGAVYGALFGVSIYQLYTIMMLLGLVIARKKNFCADGKLLIPLLIYALYAILVMMMYSMVSAVYFLLNTFCCVVVCYGYLSGNKENIREFFRVFVIIALVSVFTGAMGKSPITREVFIEDNRDIVNGTFLHIRRFMATFEDPNYMGFFLTIAIFATFTLKLFSPRIRFCVIAALYIAIFYSLSMTAIVVNAILWLAYLAISKKMNVKAVLICVVAAVACVFLYQLGLEHPNIPVLGNLSFRIEEKVTALVLGDMANVTTGRTDLSKIHWEYFLDLPVWKQLIGGTPVNTGYMSQEFATAAHNEYVDMLINVGLIGTSGLLYFMISGTMKHYKCYQNTKEETYICMLMCKGTWLLYAATLTIFTNFRFMLPFFI